MAGGMSAEAAAIAREAQMRSEASEAARIAYDAGPHAPRAPRLVYQDGCRLRPCRGNLLTPSWYSWCAWVFRSLRAW